MALYFYKKKGKNGFGYDQFLFQKTKKTFGEMKPSKKYKMDHSLKLQKN